MRDEKPAFRKGCLCPEGEIFEVVIHRKGEQMT